jgi:pimeloyl-ACP methyl ester carboxylesterase
MHYHFLCLERSDGSVVTADVRYPSDEHHDATTATTAQKTASLHKPIVLVLHGFKGFAQWGFFPVLGVRLAASGMISIVMNFSLNGVSRLLTSSGDLSGEMLTECTETDHFARNTISHECDDVRLLLHHLLRHELPLPESVYKIWDGRVFLLAHSRGGAVAWIVAPEFSCVRRIVGWCTVAHLDHFSERQRQEWHAQGFMEVQNARTGQVLKMNVEYLHDIQRHAEQYEPLYAIQRVAANAIDVLLLHGEQDMTVPAWHAQALAEAYRTGLQKAQAPSAESTAAPVLTTTTTRPIVRVEYIAQSGHTWNIVHPFAGSTPAFEAALQHTLDFLAS